MNLPSKPRTTIDRDGAFWVVLAILFLSSVGYGLTLPALPFFVERMALGPGASDAWIGFHVGLLTSVYALSQIVFGPLLGAMSDRWGRKPFLVAGLLGFASMQTVFGLGTSLLTLYVARVLAGVSAAVLLTVGSAAIADMAEDGEYLRAMAWRGMAVGSGVVAGPALSGLLSRGNMHGHQMVGSFMLDGFSVPFLAAGGLALIAAPLVVFGYRDQQARPSEMSERPPARPPSIADLLVLSAAAQFALSAFEAMFALYGRDVLSLDLNRIGWGYAVCGGVMAVLQAFLVGRSGSRLDGGRQMAIGFMAMGLGLSGVGFSRSLPAALAAISLLAAGMGVLAPNLSAAVTHRRPDEAGASLGLQNTALGVGQVFGPLVGSLLFAVAPALPFLATASFCGVIGGVLWTLRSADGNPMPRG